MGVSNYSQNMMMIDEQEENKNELSFEILLSEDETQHDSGRIANFAQSEIIKKRQKIKPILLSDEIEEVDEDVQILDTIKPKVNVF